MSAGERLVGAGAVLMAVCCALLPVAGAAFGGGLLAGLGGMGIVAGVVVLVAALAFAAHRRRARRC